MGYPYYITFLFERLENFTALSMHMPKTYGRPVICRREPDCPIRNKASIIKAQHRWLKTHPQWLKLENLPSRATLTVLADLLEAFIVYLGDGYALFGSSSTEVVYQDTLTCLRRKAQSGIRKTEMPITFQRVYTRLTQTQVGQRAITMAGFTGMDFI